LNNNPLYDPSVKAICFLKKNGDQSNCLYFTEDMLIIILKGRKHPTPVNQIRRISLGNKKLLGPIVTGGIIFPLSSLAFLGNISNPFLMMTLMIAGLFLLLYGFGGSAAISIETTGGTHHYFIRKTGKNLEDFIKYYNSEINQ
jgi:hypothetical protein